MSKTADINRLLNARFDKSAVQVWPAVVKSVEGLTCTVDIKGTELVDVPGVQLRADEEATEGVLFTPRVGSFVYVALVENSLDNLFVCLFSEVDRINMVIDKTTLTIDKKGVTGMVDQVGVQVTKDAATLIQAQTILELKGGKVSVKNAGNSLKSMLDELADLLTSLKTITPVQGVPTPSVSLDPGTVGKITQFKTGVAALLQ